MGNIVSANRDDFSNQRILRVTMACFLFFSLLELVAAIASGSLSMFGDAAAMLVDSFAYGKSSSAFLTSSCFLIYL
jgi:Co/Zn/Cd efflux system component